MSTPILKSLPGVCFVCITRPALDGLIAFHHRTSTVLNVFRKGISDLHKCIDSTEGFNKHQGYYQVHKHIYEVSAHLRVRETSYKELMTEKKFLVSGLKLALIVVLAKHYFGTRSYISKPVANLGALCYAFMCYEPIVRSEKSFFWDKKDSRE